MPKKDIYNFCREFWFRDYVSDENTSGKRPMLFLGCSYIQGTGLKDGQTLPYKLHKITGRDSYNRRIAGGGVQLALDMFEQGILQKQVPDAEYIFYVYCSYHIARLYAYQLDYLETEINQRYKIKNNKLVKIKKPVFPIYYSLFLTKEIQKYLEKNLPKTNIKITNYSISLYQNYCLKQKRIIKTLNLLFCFIPVLISLIQTKKLCLIMKLKN